MNRNDHKTNDATKFDALPLLRKLCIDRGESEVVVIRNPFSAWHIVSCFHVDEGLEAPDLENWRGRGGLRCSPL
jgi:hypothetical protein